jgi:hypothetical protein
MHLLRWTSRHSAPIEVLQLPLKAADCKGVQMDDSIAIKTELFEHREVKPNFINPCCFGEDFALWLIEKLASLVVRGFAFSQPIQEDYGWGFWAYRERDRFWVALSYVGEGPQEEPAKWVVSVSKPGVISKLFRRTDSESASQELREHIWSTLKSESAIQIVEAPRYS